MFKVIDGNLTSIFSKSKQISTNFNLATNQINKYVDVFNKLNSNQSFGKGWNNFLTGMGRINPELPAYFQELAKQGASATASVDGFYAVLLNGNTRGISNVRSVISAFNQVKPENQQAFANAVGQTNAQLGSYLRNLNNTKASMGEYTAGLVAATAKNIALKAANMALNAAIAVGISLVIAKVNDLVNAYNKSVEKAKEFINNINSLEDEIESLNDELKTNLTRLHELEKIETPTLFERDEIDRLKEYNNELERQIRLKQYNLKLEIINANKASQTAWDNMQWNNKGVLNAFDENKKWYENILDFATVGGYSNITSGIGNIANLFQGNFFDQQEIYLKEYENWVNAFENFKANSSKYSDEEYNRLLTDYENMLKEYENNLLQKRSEYETMLLGLDPNDAANSETIQRIQGFIDLFDNLYAVSQGKVSKSFTDVYNDTAFANTVIQLEELAKAGELTEDTFNKVDGIKEFKQALADVGETDINEILRSIIFHVNEQSNVITNTGVPAVTSLNDAFAKLKELLEDIVGYADTYQSAMQKISAGTGLTTDEVKKLLEIDPTLVNKLIRQEDGTWTIDLGELYASYELKVVGDGEEALAEEKEKLQNEYYSSVSELNKLQAEYDQKYATRNGQYDAQYLLDLDKRIEEAKKKVQDAKINLGQIDFFESTLDYTKSDIVRDAFDDVKKEIDDYNNQISKIDKIISSISDDANTGANELDKFNSEMQSTYGLGNVDLTSRPKVELDDGSVATVLSQLEYLWQGDEETGEYVGVHFTPILPNGEILSDDELGDYISNVLAGSNDILEADKIENGGKGLILKVDTDLQLSEEDIGSLETGSLTEHMQNVIDKADEWDVKLHEVQEQWVDLDTSFEKTSKTVVMSYDDMTDLINKFPSLSDKFKAVKNGYEIEVSALEEVRKQSYKTRNGFIDDQIAETQTAIDETKKRIELYKHEIALISSVYAYQKAIDSGLFENLKSAEQTVNAMQNLIDTLLGYKNEVLDPDNGNTTPTKTNELSNQLQQQIDYYKMLLEAVEIVTDRVIDNLEKEKDALKEKNDEQQRELDLLEAKNNLEKAKKQKVFVYKEGQGLVQVQDEKAVKDAQKEYDDIQNEIKEAEIDKQIDKWEEYKKQFSEMENNIQDTLTVEQAKKALGTDEQGLLSLDDKTIAGIRDGLAEATYKKDVEDNKDNPKYQVVSFDDFLKSVGATVSPKDFQAMVSSSNTNKPIFNPNLGNILNNMQTVNNKTTNNVIKAVFNIYDATDPQNMVKHIDKYMRNLFTQTLNSVK